MKEETKRLLADARSGDAGAQYRIGLYYENEGNIDEAFLWYDRAATQGYVYAVNALAVYHLKGMSVKRDVNKAITLLESIAEEFPTAKANLGQVYLECRGCPHDIRKGIGLLRQAADSGEGLSALLMGHIYLKGLYGLPVTYKEAIRWFGRAYELEVYDGVDILCDLYEGKYSRGVRDKEKYKYWSDIRKELEESHSGPAPSAIPPMPLSANESDVRILEEPGGRQYILIDREKAYVGLLVAETFLPNPFPDIYTEVEHIDGDMSNNAASNLRWIKKTTE